MKLPDRGHTALGFKPILGTILNPTILCFFLVRAENVKA